MPSACSAQVAVVEVHSVPRTLVEVPRIRALNFKVAGKVVSFTAGAVPEKESQAAGANAGASLPSVSIYSTAQLTQALASPIQALLADFCI